MRFQLEPNKSINPTKKPLRAQFNAGNNRMNIKPIKTDNDFHAALEETEAR